MDNVCQSSDVVLSAVNEAIIKQKSKSDDQKRSKFDKLVKTEIYCYFDVVMWFFMIVTLTKMVASSVERC